jgi:hypothetical protein
LAVPAVAIAATADPDPIYAAIEAHRRAYADWIKALRRFNEKEETPPTARLYLGDCPKKTYEQEQDGQTTIIKIHQTNEREPVYASCDQEIKEFSRQNWPDAKDGA